MIGEPSEFSPLDLFGALGLNVLATHTAIQRGQDFRVGPKIKGKVPAWADYRFLVGAGSAIASQFSDSHTIRRVGHDVANGLLNSYVATEAARMIGKNEEARQKAAVPAQLPAPAPAEAVPADATVEGMYGDEDYGW